ncbi:uncharacterized protein [Asterias amurensis]|uniref:uncharacterized protein n=1 Tax=Asterias amurensis TaxID=7602 RepID=UPI003AB5752F
MGLSPSFPIDKEPPNFEDLKAFNISGKRRQDFEQETDITEYECLTHKYFKRYVKERQDAQEAKAKFNDLVGLAARFPQWTEADIAGMRSQFLSFDINHDGLIDFPELDSVLSEMGDTSSSSVRKERFDVIDEDHSDSIDFEEFLHLIESVSSTERGGISDTIGAMCEQGSKNANIIRKLTVEQQIYGGVF